VHLRPTKDYGHLLKEGFSGAPIFAADNNTVLGMVVATQKGDESRVAYGLSLPLLRRAWPPMARPYKGLARFDLADADIFFGRETIVSELLVRTERDPITIVVGPSGGGKSSLVYAGLLPKLDLAEWRISNFRPSPQPLTPFV
jgi:hypothetical protein